MSGQLIPPNLHMQYINGNLSVATTWFTDVGKTRGDQKLAEASYASLVARPRLCSNRLTVCIFLLATCILPCFTSGPEWTMAEIKCPLFHWSSSSFLSVHLSPTPGSHFGIFAKLHVCLWECLEELRCEGIPLRLRWRLGPKFPLPNDTVSQALKLPATPSLW